MTERIIYHVDVNSAFLSWEAVFRLKFLGVRTDLWEETAAVGGDVMQRHGIILARSIPAKRYGIQTGNSIPEAKQKCPGLCIVPPDYRLYDRCSKAMIKLLREYTPQVEQYSIDEAFLDMTDVRNLYGDPVKTAEQIKDRIREELGFTVNIGISSNKLLAKMASDFRKPDRVHTLFPGEMEEKMWGLPVNDLFFVGNAAAKKLRKLGICTIGQLASADPGLLKLHLKSQGEVIWNFANGRDSAKVEAAPPPHKGYGNSTTIAFDVTDPSTARIVLLALAETVAMRIRRDQVKIQTVGVTVKDWTFESHSHQTVLPAPTDITTEIYRAACALFDEMWTGIPVRHLGIHTGRVGARDNCRQLSLFDETDYERLALRDETVDDIRDRWGIDAVKRSVFLSAPGISHLSGGISREKWNASR